MSIIATEPAAVYERSYASTINSPTYVVNDLHPPTEEHPANVVTSRVGELDDDPSGMFGGTELHAPALDIDIPMEVIPSTTPGHCHLFFPSLRLTWPKYRALLDALAEAGILEPGYVTASVGNQRSVLRLPGVRKATAPRPKLGTTTCPHPTSPNRHCDPAVCVWWTNCSSADPGPSPVPA